MGSQPVGTLFVLLTVTCILFPLNLGVGEGIHKEPAYLFPPPLPPSKIAFQMALNLT